MYHYRDGKVARLGDQILYEGQSVGQVVAIIEGEDYENTFGPGEGEEKVVILVKFEQLGKIAFHERDKSVQLIE